MVRRLSLVLILLATLLPAGVYALGLGNIHLKSALNEPFNADIVLLSVKPGELDGVKVNLASPEAFARAGMDRPFQLTKLRFKPERLESGAAVVRITSHDPIREPFLNFLVEVNWAKGRLVREYTVLLDPPVTLERKPAPVAPPVTAPAPPPVVSRVPAPPVERTQPRTAPPPPATSAASEYGPTKKRDTLWAIATHLKPGDVSLEQMMIALWRKNPHAFYEENINNLKTGQILRAPDREEMTRLTHRQAQEAFAEQVRAWRASAPVAASLGGEGEESAAPGGGETAMPTGESAETGAKLRIASAHPEGGEEVGSVQEGEKGQLATQLERELMLAREEKEGALQERNELRSRVDELKSQLADAKRMFTLKSEQLARLQAEMASQDTVDETGMPVPEGEETPVAAVELEPEQPEEMIVLDEGIDETVAVESPLEEGITPLEEPLAPAPVEPAPVTPVPQPAATGWLPDNMVMLGLAVGSVIILLTVVVIALRSGGTKTNDFEESILVPGEATAAATALGQEDADAESLPAAETSFLSDFSPSDIDALQDDTGEVDPAAEADVYIAYGRYQQAEELVNQAIERDPERLELRIKLLELYSATKNRDAFIGTAEELAAKGENQADPEAWKRVLSMGSELAPEHSLFAGGVGIDSSLPEEKLEETASEMADGELGDLDLSDLAPGLEADSSVADLGVEEGDEEEEPEFSLDLDSEYHEDTESADAAESQFTEMAPDSEASEEMLDLDLDSLALDSLDESTLQEEEEALGLVSGEDEQEDDSFLRGAEEETYTSTEETQSGEKEAFSELSSELSSEFDISGEELEEVLSEFAPEESPESGEEPEEVLSKFSSDEPEEKEPLSGLSDEDTETSEDLEKVLSELSLDDDSSDEVLSGLTTGDSPDVEENLEKALSDLSLEETVADRPLADEEGDLELILSELTMEEEEPEAESEDLEEILSELSLESAPVEEPEEEETDDLEQILSELNVEEPRVEAEEPQIEESDDLEQLFSGLVTEEPESSQSDYNLDDTVSNLFAEDIEELQGAETGLEQIVSGEEELEESGPEGATPPGDATVGDVATAETIFSVDDDMDEVSTKLDLARAYVDMGDEEGARSILGEVIGEGSDSQKAEAEALLGKIS